MYETMQEEIFGPVLTIYQYDKNRYEETLELVDHTSPYALTGAIFAQDRFAVNTATDALINAAGNFFISTINPQGLWLVSNLLVVPGPRGPTINRAQC